MARVYALLVGINDYSKSGAGNLYGCLSDIEWYEAYLKDTFADQLYLEVLRDHDAERDAIIRQFRGHLGRARQDDVALFAYAGHGARWKSAPAFKDFYPEGYDEGLVCSDSRSQSGSFPFDLADKEIALLLAELAQNEPHVAVILDSCHSGSATRGAEELAGDIVRATHGVAETRELESYLEGQYVEMSKSGAELSIPASSHILLAACKRTQSAYETKSNRGAFSHSFQSVLEKSGPDISYAELFSRCRAAMRDRKNQEPQFQAYGHFNGFLNFLGSTVRAQRRALVFLDGEDWKIECGAIHNLPTELNKPTQLALYDEEGRNVGAASTTQVGMQSSVIELPSELEPTPSAIYTAEITSLPVPPIPVYLHGDLDGTTRLKNALDSSAGIEFVETPVGAMYSVEARDQVLRLRRRDSALFVQGVAGYDNVSARTMLDVVRHVTRWERTLTLQNLSTRLAMDEVNVRFVHAHRNGQEDVYEIRTVSGRELVVEVGSTEERAYSENEIVLGYTGSGDETDDLDVRVLVRNRTSQELHCLLLVFWKEFDILIKANEPVPPGGHSFVRLHDASMLLPDGVPEETGWYKLVLSTEAIDDQSLALSALKLGEVLEPRESRALERPPKQIRYQNEWFTRTWRVKLVRQVNQVCDADLVLEGGRLTVLGHPSVRANVNLSDAPAADRSIGGEGDLLAALSRTGLTPVRLTTTRADSDSPQALELTDVTNDDDLGDHPLELILRVPLEETEQVLPVAFDGNHFLLVGEAMREDHSTTRIRIDEIPEIPVNRRSLGKALKLYFLKTYLHTRDVNTLAWLSTENGEQKRIRDGIVEEVAAARRVLVLIHGIIGDTKGIVEGLSSMARTGDGSPFDQHDVILTYDYENLSTSIADTARRLKDDLSRVGLSKSDDRYVTILAHSMGGLVSRWFIEREGGNEVVDHLVMCGTPNDGSPFGRIGSARRIVTALTTLAINYVPATVPFASGVAFVLNRLKKVTPTLEEMNPSSEFMRELNESEDPHVRYTVLAGDVDLFDESSGRFFPELIERIGKSAALDALFSKKPHDIAVSVESILRVGASRHTKPELHKVACHHLNYFVSKSGQRALADVEW